MSFKEYKVEELELNPFKFWGKDWVLITAGNEEKVNTLTAGWGGLGVFWQKNVANIYIRSTRYTKEFIDNNDRFSITSFGSGSREELGYLGRVSGRDEDKIQKVGYTTEFEDGVPYIKEGNVVLICKKLVKTELLSQNFEDISYDTRIYPEKDYHTLYIAEIEKILVKDE